jgi:hypothetical protein
MLQPANRLPPTVLSRIARDIPNYRYAEDASSIIPLTHVCRYWRESIISTPEHWTLISGRKSGLAAVSLRRAKSAPLNITLRQSPTPGDHPLSGLLIPYIQNIETLKICFVPAIELESVLPGFPGSMPNLRLLEFFSWGVKWDQFVDPFEGLTHILKRLTLSHTPLYPSLLKLRTLTELDLHSFNFNLHLDTLLGFLEENRSLERATLQIKFTKHSLRSSRRRTPIKNRLQYLEIQCCDAMDARALLSSIALSKGAKLEFHCFLLGCVDMRLGDVLSGLSTAHLSNLPSPTLMEYRAYPRAIRLLGSNGSAAFRGISGSDIPFVEFPRLPLTNVRRLHLDTRSWWKKIQPPTVFHHLSFFPALETFFIQCDADLPQLLSALFSNPSSSPSLKALVFLNCIIAEEFMEELTRFASNRKSTTSAWLHSVVILHREGKFPSIGSIRKLGEHVPVVDVRIAEELPADLI